MLYGLLLTVLIFVCFLLILMILIQQGKGGLGLGAIGGGAQMLFGGSGGQDIFQKITWTLGTFFMLGSLILFLLGAKGVDYSRYLGRQLPVTRQASQSPQPVVPSIPTLPEKTKDITSQNVAKDAAKK